jgi:hypothetical protein
MVEDVERRHEEVPGRHPLASCRWARSSPLWVAESGGGRGPPDRGRKRRRAGAHGGSSRRCWADRGGSAGIQALERAADLASAAVVAAVPLLHLAGVREFWQLVVLVFVLSSLNALGQVVGPILGGILIAASAPPTCCLSTPPRGLGCPRRHRGARGRQSRRASCSPGGHSYLAELREGLRFIRAHTVLLSMILIATVGNFLDKPLVTVILPVYAKTFYGSPPALPGPRRLRRRRPDRLPAVRLAQAGISEWPPVPAMPMGTPAWPSSPSPGPQSSSTLPCVRARARRSYA